MISVEDDGEKQGKQLRIRLRKNKRNGEKNIQASSEKEKRGNEQSASVYRSRITSLLNILVFA